MAASGDEGSQRLADTQERIKKINELENEERAWKTTEEHAFPDIEDDVAAPVNMQVYELQSSFRLFDADGDGKLTEKEVIAALTRKTGHGTEFSEEAAFATWKRWQAEYDLNDDGKVSYEELSMRLEILAPFE